MSSLIERLDELDSKRTRGPWAETEIAPGRPLREADRDFVVALVNAWPQIREVVVEAHQACDDLNDIARLDTLAETLVPFFPDQAGRDEDPGDPGEDQP